MVSSYVQRKFVSVNRNNFSPVSVSDDKFVRFLYGLLVQMDIYIVVVDRFDYDFDRNSVNVLLLNENSSIVIRKPACRALIFADDSAFADLSDNHRDCAA